MQLRSGPPRRLLIFPSSREAFRSPLRASRAKNKGSCRRRARTVIAPDHGDRDRGRVGLLLARFDAGGDTRCGDVEQGEHAAPNLCTPPPETSFGGKSSAVRFGRLRHHHHHRGREGRGGGGDGAQPLSPDNAIPHKKQRRLPPSLLPPPPTTTTTTTTVGTNQAPPLKKKASPVAQVSLPILTFPGEVVVAETPEEIDAVAGSSSIHLHPPRVFAGAQCNARPVTSLFLNTHGTGTALHCGAPAAAFVRHSGSPASHGLGHRVGGDFHARPTPPNVFDAVLREARHQARPSSVRVASAMSRPRGYHSNAQIPSGRRHHSKSGGAGSRGCAQGNARL